MANKIEERLKALGIVLPHSPTPAGNYVPFVRVDRLVYISGQVAKVDGKVVYAGQVGRDLSIEEGRQAARLCAINLLSQLKAACDGDLDKVARCVRLGGFVSSGESFYRQPEIIDAASDLMSEVFGEGGRHARVAVGAAALPSNTAVEVEGLFELF